MPTLTEAAQLLHISEKTLRKWMRRLELEPARHPYDLRYFTLTDEQVEAIRDARAQMPGAAQQAIMPPARLRAKSGRSTPLADSFSIPAGERPLDLAVSASDRLPDGMLDVTTASRRHNVPRTTLAAWCQQGLIETSGETYRRGRVKVVHPLTRKGLAQLYRLASPHGDFTPCSECPHASLAPGE